MPFTDKFADVATDQSVLLVDEAQAATQAQEADRAFDAVEEIRKSLISTFFSATNRRFGSAIFKIESAIQKAWQATHKMNQTKQKVEVDEERLALDLEAADESADSVDPLLKPLLIFTEEKLVFAG